jgi:pyridoxine/pyridoxamine 5'-phosphate oxidase
MDEDTSAQRHAQILDNQVMIMGALQILLEAQDKSYFATRLKLRVKDIEDYLVTIRPGQ